MRKQGLGVGDFKEDWSKNCQPPMQFRQGLQRLAPGSAVPTWRQVNYLRATANVIGLTAEVDFKANRLGCLSRSFTFRSLLCVGYSTSSKISIIGMLTW
jgi:hypothetical protein